MDIRTEKLWLIEYLLKIQDGVLLHRIKTLVESMIDYKQGEDVEPMTLDSFYKRIEESEKALQRGEIVTQENLREEIKT